MATRDIEKLRSECLTPGKVLELYDIGRVLGKGGFAVVREGREKKSMRHCALKILNPRGYMKDPAAAQAVFAEIRILKKVNAVDNKSLMRFFAAHEDMSATTGLPRLTIVTSLCLGGELFDAIVKKGSFTEAEAAVYISKLAAGLNQLHKAGIVHRDIKPENILLSCANINEAEPVIADFGLSKIMEEDEAPTLVGTPAYLSPEIIKSRHYSPAGDVWALGVIAYVLLCGYPPFYAENNDTKELYAQITDGAYEFHEDAWSCISPAVKDLIASMLRVRVEERATMQDVLNHPWVVTAAGTQAPPSDASAAVKSAAALASTTSLGDGNVPLQNAVRKLRLYNIKRKIRAAAKAALWGARHLRYAKEIQDIIVKKSIGTAVGVSLSYEDAMKVAEGFRGKVSAGGASSDPSERQYVVTLEDFSAVLEKTTGLREPDFAVSELFDLFDMDGSGSVDYRELLCGLTRSVASDADAAVRLAFSLFDADGSGDLTRDELVHMIRTIGVHMVGSLTGMDATTGSSSSAGSVPVASTADEDAAASALEALFNRMDVDGDGKITLDEFRLAVKNEKALSDAIFKSLRG